MNEPPGYGDAEAKRIIERAADMRALRIDVDGLRQTIEAVMPPGTHRSSSGVGSVTLPL